MWPRITEGMLGAWLLASTIMFDHGDPALIASDLAAAAVVIALALASMTRWVLRAHLGTVLVGLYLVAFGLLSDAPEVGKQNDIIVGLIFAMIAIVPSDASEPPRGWRSDGLASGEPKAS